MATQTGKKSIEIIKIGKHVPDIFIAHDELLEVDFDPFAIPGQKKKEGNLNETNHFGHFTLRQLLLSSSSSPSSASSNSTPISSLSLTQVGAALSLSLLQARHDLSACREKASSAECGGGGHCTNRNSITSTQSSNPLPLMIRSETSLRGKYRT